jgi:23S rRNA-/tRNA-specific pseudouridylate synthase
VKARLPFEIIHEDRDLIVISKPAGLLTSSLYSDERCTAQWMLGDYLR